MGNIPKTLPLSTLACPPSANYLAKFKANNQEFQRAHSPILLRELKDQLTDEQEEQKEDQLLQPRRKNRKKTDNQSSSSSQVTKEEL